MVPDTRLRQVRIANELSKPEVAEAVGTHFQNYSRIERGEQTPKKELARAIFEYWEGEVTLGEIYDATHGMD